MVHRRKERPAEGYRIHITVPGHGTLGPWQTGFHRKRDAARVEAWLREMALTRPDVIDALARHDFSLRDGWTAYLRGTLDRLLAGLADPPLAEALDRLNDTTPDKRVRNGIAWLTGNVPTGARLSWLDARQVRRLYAEARGTMRPNTVRRSVHRAIADLLLAELGPTARRELLREVRVPGEDDTRTVRLTAAECTRLLDACAPERFRWLVTVALGTAADRGPLLAMQSRQFSDREGTLEVRDAKTAHRPRVLRVVGDVRLVLRLASAGLRPLERLFPWTDNQVQWLWKKARKAAELEHVRFKDLRHVLPTELAALGVDRREIESLLGHAPGSKMTGRYITPVGLVGRLEEATARMGMSGRYLRVE
jgi:integrase